MRGGWYRNVIRESPMPAGNCTRKKHKAKMKELKRLEKQC